MRHLRNYTRQKTILGRKPFITTEAKLSNLIGLMPWSVRTTGEQYNGRSFAIASDVEADNQERTAELINRIARVEFRKYNLISSAEILGRLP